MRRITQLVALTVALLFAGQSALADVPCSLMFAADDGHAPGCCNRSSSVSGQSVTSDCHGTVHSEPTAAQCSQTGCRMATVQTVASVAKSPKFKPANSPSFVVAAQHSAVSAAIQLRPFKTAAVPGTARYLLLQVFRI
jgi:hypothetical protein